MYVCVSTQFVFVVVFIAVAADVFASVATYSCVVYRLHSCHSRLTGSCSDYFECINVVFLRRIFSSLHTILLSSTLRVIQRTSIRSTIYSPASSACSFHFTYLSKSSSPHLRSTIRSSHFSYFVRLQSTREFFHHSKHSSGVQTSIQLNSTHSRIYLGTFSVLMYVFTCRRSLCASAVAILSILLMIFKCFFYILCPRV